MVDFAKIIIVVIDCKLICNLLIVDISARLIHHVQTNNRGVIKMGEEMEHIDPPKKLWLFEQTNNAWMSWSGTEEDLREFIKGTGIKAYEYALTGEMIDSAIAAAIAAARGTV